MHCVYKPIAGEAPLWDFPDGTLAGRELAAYLVSAALGWDIVPYTIIRDGPAGRGMLQLWVDQPGDQVGEDPESGPDLVDLLPAGHIPPGFLPVLRAYDYAGDEVTLVHADDLRLRRMAVFDVLINNADRKGGHILSGVDGQVYGVDHGVSLHVEDKLRTVLWGWAGKPVDDETLETVTRSARRRAWHAGRAVARAHHQSRDRRAASQSRCAAGQSGDAVTRPAIGRSRGRRSELQPGCRVVPVLHHAVGPVGAVGGVPVADHEMQVAQRRARHDVAAVQLAQGAGGAAVGRTAPR